MKNEKPVKSGIIRFMEFALNYTILTFLLAVEVGWVWCLYKFVWWMFT